jgi:hypothetical protein
MIAWVREVKALSGTEFLFGGPHRPSGSH